MNALELTGRARTHLVESPQPLGLLHRNAASAFAALRAAAAVAGLDLVPVSGFRDFDRQLAIWNAKYRGATPVLDAAGCALDVHSLSADERIDAILRWSALPGASRHHWGTDVDLIDRRALAPGYVVRLVPEEYAASGPFAALAAWLERHAGRYGFYRPYRGERSGVGPEPWHFSFAPVALGAASALDPATLRAALENAPLAGRESVLARLQELHGRFVAAVDPP